MQMNGFKFLNFLPILFAKSGLKFLHSTFLAEMSTLVAEWQTIRKNSNIILRKQPYQFMLLVLKIVVDLHDSNCNCKLSVFATGLHFLRVPEV